MARVIAVANQKGGVAKTTSVIALSAAIAEQGPRVLALDLDPQACLTFSLGLDPDTIDTSIHDVLVGRVPIGKVITQLDEVDLVPANIDLAGAEAYLLTRTGREYTLNAALEDVRGHYDFIVVDCPPSLGVLTINALTAAGEVIIPMQCETLSHRGVGQLLATIDDIKRLTNRNLEVTGILPTMFDARTAHSKDVLDDVARRYRLPVLEPAIRKSIRFAEAPRTGRSMLKFAPSHPGTRAYREVARKLTGLPQQDAAS
ncbi:MAG TPA: AAA family ATPase [Actinomycetota bacterium]|nr:AAA family ATPase [Actinomycetota bacterium]